jgi:hypothetical protein
MMVLFVVMERDSDISSEGSPIVELVNKSDKLLSKIAAANDE